MFDYDPSLSLQLTAGLLLVVALLNGVLYTAADRYAGGPHLAHEKERHPWLKGSGSSSFVTGVVLTVTQVVLALLIYIATSDMLWILPAAALSWTVWRIIGGWRMFGGDQTPNGAKEVIGLFMRHCLAGVQAIPFWLLGYSWVSSLIMMVVYAVGATLCAMWYSKVEGKVPGDPNITVERVRGLIYWVCTLAALLQAPLLVIAALR